MVAIHSIHSSVEYFTILQLLSGEERVAATAATLVILTFGVYNIHQWRTTNKRAGQLKAAPEPSIGSAGSGEALISGIARPATETLEREATDGTCLGFERETTTKQYAVERNTERGEDHDRELETVKSSTSEAVPFIVEDDTGSLFVNPTRTPVFELQKTASHTETPSREEQGLEEMTKIGHQRDEQTEIAERQHTYRELLPGDEVVVFGEVTQGDGSNEIDTDQQLTDGSSVEKLVISHFPKETVIDRYTKTGPLISGLAIIGIGLVGLAYLWIIM